MKKFERKKLANERKNLGLSQKQLGRYISEQLEGSDEPVDNVTISRWERGKQTPSDAHEQAWRRALIVAASDLSTDG